MKILLILFTTLIFFTKGYSQQNNTCITNKMNGLWQKSTESNNDTIIFKKIDTIERRISVSYIEINNDSIFRVGVGLIRCGTGLSREDPFGHWEIGKNCLARFGYERKIDTLNSYRIALPEDTRLTFIKIK